jgi:hypothetical protein
MALRRKMHDSLRAVLLKQILEQVRICNVSLNEVVERILVNACQVGGIAGIRNQIEGDGSMAPGDPLQDKVRTNEPCAACYKNVSSHIRRLGTLCSPPRNPFKSDGILISLVAEHRDDVRPLSCES